MLSYCVQELFGHLTICGFYLIFFLINDLHLYLYKHSRPWLKSLSVWMFSYLSERDKSFLKYSCWNFDGNLCIVFNVPSYALFRPLPPSSVE